MLACYTRFVLVTIYVCRSRGSTKRVFSQAVSLLCAIFQYKISYNAFALDCFKVDIKKGTFLKNMPFSKQKFTTAPYKVQYFCLLVMEQADSVETHYHSIFICCFDYLIVTNRSAWLCNNCYTRFSCAFDVVSEREECI